MAKVAVQFVVRARILKDEILCIIGDQPELGSWQLDQAKQLESCDRLSTTKEPVFAFNTSFDLGTVVQYRYLVKNSEGSLQYWESRPSSRVYFSGYVNRAAFMPTKQSSTFRSSRGPYSLPRPAALAVNGATASGEWLCSRTEEEDQPWWEVELPRQAKISKIVLWEPASSKERKNWNNDMELVMSSTSISAGVAEVEKDISQVCVALGERKRRHEVEIKAPQAFRFVRVQLKTKGTLSLAEVAVLESHTGQACQEVDDGWLGCNGSDLYPAQSWYNVQPDLGTDWLWDQKRSLIRFIVGNRISQPAVEWFGERPAASLRLKVCTKFSSQTDSFDAVCNDIPFITLDPRPLEEDDLDEELQLNSESSVSLLSLRESVGLFRQLTNEEYDTVCHQAKVLNLHRGEKVQCSQEPAAAYLIISGKVQLLSILGEKRAVKAGDVVGIDSLFQGLPFFQEVKALTELTCLMISADNLWQALGLHRWTELSRWYQRQSAYGFETEMGEGSSSAIPPRQTQLVASTLPTDNNPKMISFGAYVETAALPSTLFEFNILGERGEVLGLASLIYRQLNPSVTKASLPIIATGSSATGNPLLGVLQVHVVQTKPFSHENCNLSRSQRSKALTPVPLIVGHRGMGRSFRQPPGYRVSGIGENTVLSFALAGGSSADYVEFDVQLSSDLVPVVYHDFQLFVKLRGVSGPFKTGVHTMTLHDLQSVEWAPISHPTSKLQWRIRKHWTKIIRMRGREWQPHARTKFRASLEKIPTLEEVFRYTPPHIGFNVEIKYPLGGADAALYDLPHFDMNTYVDTILRCVFDHAGDRRVFFSSFDPDVCAMLHWKQPIYPVLFLTNAGMYTYYPDRRCLSFDQAVSYVQAQGLEGVVSHSTPLLKHPRLVHEAKKRIPQVVTWGDRNTLAECVEQQLHEPVDGIISDNVIDLKRQLGWA